MLVNTSAFTEEYGSYAAGTWKMKLNNQGEWPNYDRQEDYASVQKTDPVLPRALDVRWCEPERCPEQLGTSKEPANDNQASEASTSFKRLQFFEN